MKNLKRITVVVFATIMLMPCLLGQEARIKGLDAITESAVKGQLEFLASDWMEGRQTGTKGAYMAADYIASMFKVYGLQPGGDLVYPRMTRADWMAGRRPSPYRTYYQVFPLIEYKPGAEQSLALVKRSKTGETSLDFAYRTDFDVSTTDVAMEVEAPVVFVGYAFTDEESGYDDFKGVDVKGKIILSLSGYPGIGDTTSAGYKKFASSNSRRYYRQRMETLEKTGAIAMISFSPGSGTPDSWGANVPFRYNSDDYEGDVPRSSFSEYRMKHPGDEVSGGLTRISVSERVVNEMLKGTGIDPEAFAERVKNSLKPESEELDDVKIRLKTSVDSRIARVRNVIGVLPGKDTSEIIVVGGHYDHLGKHDGYIWNGADDNASGTVGVMTLAKAFAASGEKPEKTIVFCAWTGEEKGLLGSEYFADHPYNDATMILNLNYDMISRDDPDDSTGNKVGMTYTEKYKILEELSEKHNKEFDMGLEIEYSAQERPRGGSDHTPFAAKDIPIFYYMAGFPPEYHSIGDHVDLVNWEKMVKIIKLGYLSLWELSKEGLE